MARITDIDPARLYTSPEVARFIPSRFRGRKVHVRSVVRWINAGKLQAQRVGNTWLVLGANLLRFLGVQPEECEQAPADVLKAVQEARGRIEARRLLLKYRRA